MFIFYLHKIRTLQVKNLTPFVESVTKIASILCYHHCNTWFPSHWSRERATGKLIPIFKCLHPEVNVTSAHILLLTERYLGSVGEHLLLWTTRNVSAVLSRKWKTLFQICSTILLHSRGWVLPSSLSWATLRIDCLLNCCQFWGCEMISQV